MKKLIFWCTSFEMAYIYSIMKRLIWFGDQYTKLCCWLNKMPFIFISISPGLMILIYLFFIKMHVVIQTIFRMLYKITPPLHRSIVPLPKSKILESPEEGNAMASVYQAWILGPKPGSFQPDKKPVKFESTRPNKCNEGVKRICYL